MFQFIDLFLNNTWVFGYTVFVVGIIGLLYKLK